VYPTLLATEFNAPRQFFIASSANPKHAKNKSAHATVAHLSVSTLAALYGSRQSILGTCATREKFECVSAQETG
jgi:surfactin synthase thioesterase subunit